MIITIDLSTLEVTTDKDTPYAEAICRIYEDISIQLMRILVESKNEEVKLTISIKEEV